VLPLLERIVVYLEQVRRGTGEEELVEDGFVTTYCDRLALTTGMDAAAELAPAGSTLLRLRGMDRLRWLLAVETSIATSSSDPWCVDLDTVRFLASNREWSGSEEVPLPISTRTSERWAKLGALQRWNDSQYREHGYELSPVGCTLFSELARDDATSFRTLVRAFLEDEREQVLSQRTTTSSSQDRATAATLFSVMEAIDEARRECVPSPEGGILIEAVPASANPLCRGHRGRFVLALINLLRNSVQMGGLGVRIEISVDGRESGKVTVSVGDDGPGVPEAQRDALFENGVSHRDGGAGHGLAFVRLVVEGEMHGRLRLISEPEGGANFILEFPAEEDAR